MPLIEPKSINLKVRPRLLSHHGFYVALKFILKSIDAAIAPTIVSYYLSNLRFRIGINKLWLFLPLLDALPNFSITPFALCSEARLLFRFMFLERPNAIIIGFT
jgi:hypothetical protein